MTDFTDKIHRFESQKASWLSKFNWGKIKFGELPSWVPFVGIYLPFLRKILVKPENGNDDLTFATCVHELRHAWQFHSYGAVRYLLKKAFFRSSIEEDAEDWEIKAVEWSASDK